MDLKVNQEGFTTANGDLVPDNGESQLVGYFCTLPGERALNLSYGIQAVNTRQLPITLVVEKEKLAAGKYFTIDSITGEYTQARTLKLTVNGEVFT
jgi:hypothetical protein